MEDLQILNNKLNDIGEEYGLHINIGNTKMMVISRYPQEDTSLFIKDQEIERVTKLKYLGSTTDGIVMERLTCELAWQRIAL